VSAGAPEDAGQDDSLHLLRAHGDRHENLHSTNRRNLRSLTLLTKEVMSGG
jgi:hypothetical protein